MSLGGDRLASLARTRLEGLVRSAFPQATAAAESFNAGVGLEHDGRAFVYLIDDAPSPLAAVLAWGEQRGATELHVVVDDVDPTLALQARGLDPSPTLWHAVGAELVPVAPDAPATSRPTVPDSVRAEVATLQRAGCEVVIEHGVVIGEVLGVEVARVAVELDGTAVVRVGVGVYDQEAHALVYADATIDDRLRQVVNEVRRHRRRDAGPHPLNRLARERWLRSLILADPASIGLDSLDLEEPVEPRGGIHDERPVAARGMRGERRVLAVCSTGIDLDLVPTAAAHIAVERPDEVILVLPERDHHPVIERMARHLAAPAALVAIPDPWPL